MLHRRTILILLFAMMAAVLVSNGLSYVLYQRQQDSGAELRATVTELRAVEQRQTAETDCQAAYNQQMAIALAARFNSGAAIQVTLHAFLLSLVPVLDHPASPAEVQAISNRLESYLQKYAHYQMARQAHPLPPLPNRYCNEDNGRGGNR